MHIASIIATIRNTWFMYFCHMHLLGPATALINNHEFENVNIPGINGAETVACKLLYNLKLDPDLLNLISKRGKFDRPLAYQNSRTGGTSCA